MFSKDYIIPPPYGGSYRWYGQVEGNLSWNLDFWGKQKDLIAKAGDNANAAMLDAQGARLALSGAVPCCRERVWAGRSTRFTVIGRDLLS